MLKKMIDSVNRNSNYEEYSDAKSGNIFFSIEFIATVIMYILIMLLQKLSRVPSETIQILLEFELILSICITIKFANLGYVIAMVLNIIQLSILLFSIIILGVGYFKVSATVVIINSITLTLVIYIINRGYKNKDNLEIEQNKNSNPYIEEKAGHFDSERPVIVMQNKTSTIMIISINNFVKYSYIAKSNSCEELNKDILNILKATSNDQDTIKENGEAEFILSINRNLSKAGILKYAEAIKEQLESKKFTIGKYIVQISISIGIYIPADVDEEYIYAVNKARMALYDAQNKCEKRISVYDNEIEKSIRETVVLEFDLKEALNNNELFIMFQPQYLVDAGNCKNSIRGVEALVRWSSPEFGMVSPDRFIPMAEREGYIVDIGKWVLTNACIKAKRIMDKNGVDFILCVNISYLQIKRHDFLDMIRDVINDTGIKPQNLELEITESILIEFNKDIADKLNRILKMGINISLDDFGAGYCSLNYICKIPLTTLKIDKSLIDNIEEVEVNREVVKSLINFCHSMKVSVIAEGLEKENQLEYMKKYKCDYIQGFLLAKPMEEIQLVELFKN